MKIVESTDLLIMLYAYDKCGITDYTIRKNAGSCQVNANISSSKKKAIDRITTAKSKASLSGFNILTRDNISDNESGAISEKEMLYFRANRL